MGHHMHLGVLLVPVPFLSTHQFCLHEASGSLCEKDHPCPQELQDVVSQSVGPRALTAPGNLGSTLCVVTRPPGDADVRSGLRTATGRFQVITSLPATDLTVYGPMK